MLESGGNPPPESYIPALNFLLFEGEADWNFFTTSQNVSLLAYENNVSITKQFKSLCPVFSDPFNTNASLVICFQALMTLKIPVYILSLMTLEV